MESQGCRDDIDRKRNFESRACLTFWRASRLAARGDIGIRTLTGHADASVTMRTYAAFTPAADTEAAEHIGRTLVK